jgi:hypothetical protein
MKTFWVSYIDKNRFIEALRDHHITELRDPYWALRQHSETHVEIVKYYQYRADITDEEYSFLKLMFDLKEEL